MEKSLTNVFTVRKHLQTRATLKIIWEFTLARNLIVVHSVQYRFLPQVNWKYIQLFTQVRNLTNVPIVRSHLDIKGTWRSIWVRVHHVRVHPQRRKLYSCSQCEKSFPAPCALQKHARLHWGKTIWMFSWRLLLLVTNWNGISKCIGGETF
jgi:hypothetical protein